jgi:hypothetical protein
MNLEKLLDALPELPEEECILARKPWTHASEAITAPLGEDFRVPTKLTEVGLEYFLEVHVAKEVLEVLGDRPASREKRLELLIFYAENDAYPSWVYK